MLLHWGSIQGVVFDEKKRPCEYVGPKIIYDEVVFTQYFLISARFANKNEEQKVLFLSSYYTL